MLSRSLTAQACDGEAAKHSEKKHGSNQRLEGLWQCCNMDGARLRQWQVRALALQGGSFCHACSHNGRVWEDGGNYIYLYRESLVGASTGVKWQLGWSTRT